MKTRIYICALAALFMIPLAVTAQTKKKAKKEVAIQLYSVRDILNKVDNKNGKCDPTYTALLKKLANMGYTGVEAANYNNGKFYDRTPQQFKKDVESAGLKVLSSHCTRQLSKEELASFFQMDLYWVVRGQNSPVDYFNKYPGRFQIFHVKDHREIGQSGMVGFDAIFKNAKTAGVNYLVAEIEGYSVPVEESVEVSLDYLLNAPFVKSSYAK